MASTVGNEPRDLVKAVHRATNGASVTKSIIMKLKEVPGAWTPQNKSGKKTKWEHFTAAVAKWPYLFDLPVGSKCARADVHLDLLDELLQDLGAGCFGGGFEDWGPVSRRRKHS